MRKKHLHAFIRRDGMSVDAVGILTIYDSDSIEERSASEALTAMESAVTKWVAETTEGTTAYAESSEDYNIGDFVMDFDRDVLRPYLEEEGIARLELETVCPEQTNEYDRHLVQEDSLPAF